MGKRLIVTGGAGFIGSHLVRRALERGDQVLNVDKLTYAGNLANLADVEQMPGYQFVQADITAGTTLEALFAEFRPEAVLHLAAESHVDRSIASPDHFIESNIRGTYQLLETTRRYLENWKGEGFRFIHVSTDEVYGSLGPEGVFHESSPYAPRSPYAASKAASDHLARAWAATYGLPVIVTHSSNNYGPHQYPEKLIPTVILNALAGRQIPIYGNGENVRDWLFVGDHVEALLTVLDRGEIGATYNIGADCQWRNIDLVHHLCAVLDELHPRPDARSHADRIAFVKDRLGHDFRYALDSRAIRDQLGWRPSADPYAALRLTVQWYLTHRATG